jgi:calcineurin-like phosphoesterase family protein
VSKTWFTADMHFGHERIIELSGRPFGSVEEMNEVIIERYNRVVGEHDTVWILGDVALGAIAESLPLLGRLKGRKYLIAGNHDRCFAGAQPDPGRLARWKAAYIEQGALTGVVTSAGYISEPPKFKTPIRIPRLGGGLGPPVTLSHFPYAGESDPARPDRYATARPVRRKGDTEPWLLHGHVHEAWAVSGYQINVGVDIWNFEPVDAETLAALIEGGPQFDEGK